MKTPKLRLILIWGVVLTLLITVQATAAEKVLRVALPDSLGTLDPGYWANQSEAAVMSAVLPRLVNYLPGKKWVYENELAKSIEVIDPTTIAFALKPGFQWSNGYGDITAEDVKFSFERFGRLNAPNKGDWAPLKEVIVKDKYNGVIKLSKPFAPLFTSTLPYLSGMIICKKAALELGDKKMGVELKAYGGNYRIKEWLPKQRLVVVANEGWAGAKPVYGEIEFVQVSDDKAAENAFLSGDIDFGHVPITAVASLEKKSVGKGSVEVYATDAYLWLGMNMENPVLKDERIRKALKLAVDVPTVLDAGYMGAAEVATGMISANMIGHVDTKPKYDPDQARRLLKEAGATNLKLTLDVQARPERITMAQVIQANLADVGINVVINQHDAGSFWSLAKEKQDELQLTLKNFVQPPDPSWGTQWFITEQAGSWNWEWFKNAKFDQMHDAALSELNDSKRTEIYKSMMHLMNESDAFIWLTYLPQAVVYSKNIKPAITPDSNCRWDLFE